MDPTQNEPIQPNPNDVPGASVNPTSAIPQGVERGSLGEVASTQTEVGDILKTSTPEVHPDREVEGIVQTTNVPKEPIGQIRREVGELSGQQPEANGLPMSEATAHKAAEGSTKESRTWLGALIERVNKVARMFPGIFQRNRQVPEKI